jgi:hypothetical protein
MNQKEGIQHVKENNRFFKDKMGKQITAYPVHYKYN